MFIYPSNSSLLPLPSPSLPVTHASLSMPYKTIRDTFTNQCAVILACYRKQCSSQSPAGQLILPESLKLLPMYANCMLKSDALLSREWTCLSVSVSVHVYMHVYMNRIQSIVYMCVQCTCRV